MSSTRSQNRIIQRTLSQRWFWRLFLHDLSYLLPAFGALLGVLLLLGRAPHWGASLLTLGVFMLMLRINSAFSLRRERRFLEYFKRWTRTYFGDQGPRQSSCRSNSFDQSI
ncbi:MAG: hypothetical protein ACK562_11920 [Acidobacteriota bacterium]|jgi:hypothetical protein